MELNERQNEAVHHPGNLLVAAPPGSGKTRVIIERAKRILDEDPKATVALTTFTVASSEEMLHRIGDKYGRRVQAATFDSYCLRMLKQAKMKFRVVDNMMRYQIISRAIRNCPIVVDGKNTYMKVKEATCSIDVISAMPSQAERELHPDYDIFAEYEDKLEQLGVLDFRGISRRVVAGILNKRIPPLAVTHLLCDEFQDTDCIQGHWVRAHYEAGINVTVVGDDDQSIYAFRQAMGNQGMLDFKKGAEAREVLLDTCYRSHSEVVDHAVKLIGHNSARIRKKVIAPLGTGGTVSRRGFRTAEEEALAICLWAEESKSNGMRVGVLARTNININLIEPVLRKSYDNLKIVRLGGKPFWDSSAPQAMLNALQAIADSTHGSAMEHVCAWMKCDEALISQLNQDLKAYKKLDELNPADYTGHMATLAKKLPGWMMLVKCGSPATAVSSVLNWMVKAEKMEDREKALTAAAGIVNMKIKNGRSLRQALADIRNARKEKIEIGEADVVISTLHGSKGLEFNRCWVAGVSKDEFPSKKSTEEEQIEEERRILYVGMTRAEKDLVVSHVGEPSRFLNEMGAEAPARKKFMNLKAINKMFK